MPNRSSSPNLGSKTADSFVECAHFRQPGRQADEAPTAPEAGIAAHDTWLSGTVQIAGSPVPGANVTLYAAGPGAPAVGQGKTNGDGVFKLDGGQAPEGSVLYLVAKGGTPKAAEAKGPNEAIGLLAVLGTAWPKKVTVNEFTTIASAMTCDNS